MPIEMGVDRARGGERGRAYSHKSKQEDPDPQFGQRGGKPHHAEFDRDDQHSANAENQAKPIAVSQPTDDRRSQCTGYYQRLETADHPARNAKFLCHRQHKQAERKEQQDDARARRECTGQHDTPAVGPFIVFRGRHSACQSGRVQASTAKLISACSCKRLTSASPSSAPGVEIPPAALQSSSAIPVSAIIRLVEP